MNTPSIHTESLRLQVDDDTTVSALLTRAAKPQACYVFAHGAGAGMAHAFMAQVAEGLAHRHISSLRYQFPYMERDGKRTDAAPLAHATVRAAVRMAASLAEGLPLLAGGKSFGGRMSSQAQAIEPLPGVVGLAFWGFPLHPAGKPSSERAAHLFDVDIPMLFLHGSADKLAEPARFVPLMEQLGAKAQVIEIEQADHSFHVPKRSGRTDDEVLETLLDGFAAWQRAWVRR